LHLHGGRQGSKDSMLAMNFCAGLLRMVQLSCLDRPCRSAIGCESENVLSPEFVTTAIETTIAATAAVRFTNILRRSISIFGFFFLANQFLKCAIPRLFNQLSYQSCVGRQKAFIQKMISLVLCWI
jgi:hypothetical protein